MKHFVHILTLALALAAFGVVAKTSHSISNNLVDVKPGANRLGLNEIYPNPANNYVKADYTFPANVQSAKVVIYNVLGSKIEELELSRTDKQITVNTSDYSGGVYIFTLSVDGVTEFSKRLIVKH